MIVLGIFVFLYILAGFVLMAIFPRPDASLAQLKLLSTTSFAIVGLVSLLLGFISFIRISSVKDHPRLKMLALIRVAIVLLPVILVSVLVPVPRYLAW
jgi:ACR3 family arsenite efflux pump ArsB